MELKISLYFLSTFFLIIGGILSFLPMVVKANEALKSFILSSKFQMRMGVYGIFTIIIFGFFPFDSLIIIGDLLPFISSLVITILFILGFIRESKHLNENDIQRADKFLTMIQILIGFISFIVGVLHMIFPKIPIL